MEFHAFREKIGAVAEDKTKSLYLGQIAFALFLADRDDRPYYTGLAVGLRRAYIGTGLLLEEDTVGIVVFEQEMEKRHFDIIANGEGSE